MKFLNNLRKIILEITSADAYKQYYSAENISKDEFEKIVNLDPTYNSERDIMGKYTKWLLKKNNLDTIQKTKDEDLYKIKQDLLQFDKAKIRKKVPKEYSDINKFDIKSLASYVFDNLKDVDSLSQNQSAKLAKEDSEKYETDNWYIIVPKTKEASCYYGKGTRWCTAAKNDEDNYFDTYANEGNLWILINKQYPSEKYQIHFETGSLMDTKDQEVDSMLFFTEYPDILKFFGNKGYILRENDINYDYVIENFNSDNSDLSSSVLIDLLENPSSESFDYFDEISLDIDFERYYSLIDDKIFQILLEDCQKYGIIDDSNTAYINNFYDMMPYIENTEIHNRLDETYTYIVKNKARDYLIRDIEKTINEFIADNYLQIALHECGLLNGDGKKYPEQFEYDFNAYSMLLNTRINRQDFTKYFTDYYN